MMQSYMRVHLSGLCLGLVFLVSCSSAGLSGSSGPDTAPIPAIHGLWLEADDCNCEVNPRDAIAQIANSNLVGTPVRCYHYFADSNGPTKAVSGYILVGDIENMDTGEVETAQRCNTSHNINRAQINKLKAELGEIVSADGAFYLVGNQIPNNIGSVTYAVATMRNGTQQQLTIQREGHNEHGRTRIGSGLDFLYTDAATSLLGPSPGGNGIICSSYWKKSDNELYLGVPGAQHDENCRSVLRYTRIERYVRLGE